MTRTKLYRIYAAPILGAALFSACSLLAAELGDEMTTISPANMPIFREHARPADILEHHANAATETHGSQQASERLMKELKEINKSDNYKKGLLSVELVNDNLYDWRVNLSFPDPESVLHSDLKRLESEGYGRHVVLRMSFGDNYPAEPPFVRIAYPALKGKWIYPGGALCIQQLGKQYWNSDYSMEGVILSIADKLVEGKARVTEFFLYDLKYHTDEMARKEFARIVRFHERWGW